MSMKVSFVVVARNGAKTLEELFACLDGQDYPHDAMELILVDGLSEDGTRRLMEAYAARCDFARAVVLDNPGRTLPCGWNVALDAVQGEAVLRLDAHAWIPADFVSRSVAALEKGEDIAGGKVLSVPAGDDAWSAMLNRAENSMFGGGFAAFRRADTPRYVSTAAFAIYRKAVFDRVGRYNEALSRTEDNEMHYRMRQAGYRFFYDPAIVSRRKTRGSLRALAKQKYQNGYWIGITLGVEPRCFSLYHFVPAAFVGAVLVTGGLALGGVRWPARLLWAAYGAADLVMTGAALAGAENRSGWDLLLPLVFPALHLSYGAGTLAGGVRMLTGKIRGRSAEK